MKVPLNGTLWEILYNSNLQWSHSASEANQVAQETLSISKKIIEQADAKEFDGKDTIRV